MNLMKLLGNLGNLSKLQGEMQAVTAELAQRRYEGSAGGGLVKASVNGTGQLDALTIDPQLMADNDRELLEELVMSAVNEAASRAKTESAQLLQKTLAEKLDLGDMSGLLSGFFPK